MSKDVDILDVLKHLKSRFGHLWDDVTDLIIRPPRAKYNVDERLGPRLFRLDAGSPHKYCREDIDLPNPRDLNLKCSWYFPHGQSAPLPCIIYLHGNCGSRIDGQEILWTLRLGFTVFTFDFSGSGLSDGDFVSLGFYERQDLAAIVEFILSTRKVSSIALWGRSMGAVTAIMYAARDKTVSCVVADSPFSTLRLLVEDLVQMHGSWVPSLVVDAAVDKIRSNVMKRAQFDIDDLDTLKYAARCDTPIFIFHGQDDTFVRPGHSEGVAEHYSNGPCIHHVVQGDHNSKRKSDVTDVATGFLTLYLIDKARLAAQTQSPVDLTPVSDSLRAETLPAPELSIEERVTRLREVLPQFNLDYADLAFEYYAGDVKRIVNASLNGNLPPHLADAMPAGIEDEQDALPKGFAGGPQDPSHERLSPELLKMDEEELLDATSPEDQKP